MASKSSIEWTEVTWNPITGCSKISAGCKYCYAERLAKRLQSMKVPQYKDGFKVTLAPHALNTPYKWRKPKIVFVNSMSDLFHEDVSLDYIKRVFDVMNNTNHIYQILTKRSERLLEVSKHLKWTKNIWMGVSVEEEKVSYRILDLIETEAKVKFLSVEPLINEVRSLYLENIDWVIVGGESGPKARLMKKEWVDIVRHQCERSQTPFFFKQWGKNSFNVNPEDPTMNTKHDFYAKGGCQLDGKIYRNMPSVSLKMV